MSDRLYKVVFYNQNQVYEVYAAQIYQSDMYGFIEIEEYVFGEQSQLIVDPAEEKLKTEFSEVIRSYIPLHAIIRIDEVKKRGVGKIHDADGRASNVSAFPQSLSSKFRGDSTDS